MKDKMWDWVNFLLAGALLVVILFMAFTAGATERMNRDGTDIDVSAVSVADSNSDAIAESSSESSAVSGASSEATGGSNGDMVSVNEHTFLAYGQSDRPATGCFVSGDAAGSGNGKFGALGIYWLDTNCWMDTLAAQETDIDINARLKCGGRKYRNAVAYDARAHGMTKREYCIQKVSASSKALIQEQRDEIASLKADRDYIMAEHAKIVQECEAANARGDERLARCERGDK